VRYWVGLTDRDWYRLLAHRSPDEVNFWQPSPRRPVTLEPGAPFLFKLHASAGGKIVGGGTFAHYTRIPISMAWDVFGEKNGVATLAELVSRVTRYRRTAVDALADEIGCMVLVQPFFLEEHAWIEAPGWKGPTQRGRTYDTTEADGSALWESVERARAAAPGFARMIAEDEARYGQPILVAPRLGQGSFRTLVTDAYERRCAITGERTLPVLSAAHIKPYGQSGPHRLDNGLLLRADIHLLFDRGYVTVTPDLTVRMSRRIREEFENGRDYYALDGRDVRGPLRGFPPPSREHLEWHGDTIFRS